tara:strand:+ start:11266 stop:12486 length:1221 start_codon:yes stop_codon:yes gene_type:complete
MISASNGGPPQAYAWLRARASKSRNISGLRALAARRLPRGIFDFIDGGAEDERTLTDNSAAYGRVRLLPRVLVDVSRPDARASLLGTESGLPFAIGPTGAAGFVWPRGDLALARAAAQNDIPFALSTTSSVSIEHLRERIDGRLWFQSYIFRQRDFTERLIRRARDADYEALIITVDLPVGGNRERDYRNDFSVPFRYTPRNVLDFALHPEWVMTTMRHGFPSFGNLTEFNPSADAVNVSSTVGRNYDPSFDWDGLKRIRDIWPNKLIVKGIAHPEDARRLVEMGADAIVVSNHGGRQLDTGPATLDALPAVRAEVGARVEVYVDGGIRRGSDVFKALALGADAVLLGRATLYGLAAAGEVGAERAASILKEELLRTMQLCGVTRISDINRQYLIPGDFPDIPDAP